MKVGQKIAGREVVAVSDDGAVFAEYCPADMGKKGRIWGRMWKTPTAKQRERYWEAGVLIRMYDGNYYELLEYPADLPETMTRFMFWTTSPKSVYSRK